MLSEDCNCSLPSQTYAPHNWCYFSSRNCWIASHLHNVVLCLAFLNRGGRQSLRYAQSRPSFALLTKPQISSQNKSLVILRLCNELLRRLSRAEDPVFCGRVYIFMFQSFPLGDKSSVNLRGNFHVENVTTFEEFLNEANANEDRMQVDDDAATTAVKPTADPEDSLSNPSNGRKTKEEPPKTLDIDTLYPVFWSLQHSFSNPPRLFEENNFKEFRSSLEATLAKFREVPKVIQSGDNERKKGPKPSSGDSYDAFANSFNPKYLTSRDLFKLEVCMWCPSHQTL